MNFFFYLTEIDQFPTNNNAAGDSAASPSQLEDIVAGTHIILRSQPDSGERSERHVHRYMSNSIFYRICTTFEVKVQTQSMKAIEAETEDQINMWTTKEANSCVLTALLLRLVPV